MVLGSFSWFVLLLEFFFQQVLEGGQLTESCLVIHGAAEHPEENAAAWRPTGCGVGVQMKCLCAGLNILSTEWAHITKDLLSLAAEMLQFGNRSQPCSLPNTQTYMAQLHWSGGSLRESFCTLQLIKQSVFEKGGKTRMSYRINVAPFLSASTVYLYWEEFQLKVKLIWCCMALTQGFFIQQSAVLLSLTWHAVFLHQSGLM